MAEIDNLILTDSSRSEIGQEWVRIHLTIRRLGITAQLRAILVYNLCLDLIERMVLGAAAIGCSVYFSLTNFARYLLNGWQHDLTASSPSLLPVNRWPVQ